MPFISSHSREIAQRTTELARQVSKMPSNQIKRRTQYDYLKEKNQVLWNP